MGSSGETIARCSTASAGRCGPGRTVHARVVRWHSDGTWDRLLAHGQTTSDSEAVGEVVGEGSGDSPVVRAHQHAAGARKTGAPRRRVMRRSGAAGEPGSRGGVTTTLPLACDGRGRPLSVVLTPGQRQDSTPLEPVLDAIRVPRPSGRGRPRKRPDHLIGAMGDSAARCRRLVRRRGIRHTMPDRSDQRARRTHPPGRTPACCKATHRRRTVVERGSNRLEQWRGIATRFARRAVDYWAMVVVASLMIWLGQ